MRNVVRQKLVARQLDEQLAERFAVGQRLRVLDVGMGQGTQALRLARAGHKVTGVDQDPGVIAAAREALSGEPEGIRERVRLVQSDGRDTGVHFLPGCFDVVLCHGVLMYAEERDALLAGLARMLAPGGLLSLLVRNGDALAMRPGLSGDWAGALGAFDTLSYSPDSLDFPGSPGSPGSPDSPELSAVPEQGGPPPRLGHGLRADRLDALTATLAGIGAPLHAWYGVRVFTDTVADGAEIPGDVQSLLAAEERAGRTDPYRQVAALLHLRGVRG